MPEHQTNQTGIASYASNATGATNTGTSHASDAATIHIPANPQRLGLARVTRNVAYKTGADDLVMDIIAPQNSGDADDRRYPTVVFVQGSAWTTPDRDYELPQLAELARAGYVVATVNHRNASRNPQHVFPAYLEDVKAAIRYLRANAAQWHVDPERLGIWGTSSGGNTALLVGMTADDPRYEDGTWPQAGDAVDFVVACFPPTDLTEAIDAFGNEDDPFRLYYFGPFAAVVGATPATGLDDAVRSRAAEMSPYLHVEDGRGYPPMLLLHGTGDTVVPYRQSVKMRDRLVAHGYDARLVLVDGAEHEQDFWSRAVLDEIFGFIREHS
ncbi:alpha/beta hydrolase [Bifidobacterium saguinibicoloris]|uniref:alpha/beta hydrolase n=1 Tax=Bifidobacterium saguinibicoloris TaxID=2834433 RepID=UPI001C5694BB|nr:alpha/beta hydrolase [Bifidobacterium saguinibicoloris]MBW3080937.1 alpha/beta hydrolase [Bifidobacterium saguinibicoloris]